MRKHLLLFFVCLKERHMPDGTIFGNYKFLLYQIFWFVDRGMFDLLASFIFFFHSVILQFFPFKS